MARRRDWTLTFRHGPKVDRAEFADLDEAVAALRERIEEVRAEGPLKAVKMFRQYEPERRVNARAELSRGGFLRSTTAGVDLMGDGSLVPYAGSVRRRLLDAPEGGTAFDAVRDFLSAHISDLD